MIVGVDIGGSKILVAGSGNPREIIDSRRIATPDNGEQGVKDIIAAIEGIVGQANLEAIGIGAAGPVDRDKGIILPPSANMHGWSNTNVVKPLQDHFEVPVALQVDAAAAALTESTYGAGKGKRHMLYLTISTGIGAALVTDGHLYQGAHNLEAGHIIIDPDGPECGCGGRGHFEAMVAGPAIKKRYGKYGYEITDPAIWDEIAATMALGVHSLIVAYAPSIVVIGGGVGVHYDQFHDFLVKHLAALHPMFTLPSIVKATYMETAVAHGALIVASKTHS